MSITQVWRCDRCWTVYRDESDAVGCCAKTTRTFELTDNEYERVLSFIEDEL